MRTPGFSAGIFCQARDAYLLYGVFQGILFSYAAARVAEQADALDLGSSGQPWEFESPLSHQYPLLRSENVAGFAACCDAIPKELPEPWNMLLRIFRR